MYTSSFLDYIQFVWTSASQTNDSSDHDSWTGQNPGCVTSPGNDDDIKDNRQASCLYQVLFDQTGCRLLAHWFVAQPADKGLFNQSPQQPAEPARMGQVHLQRGRLLNADTHYGLSVRKEVDYSRTLFLRCGHTAGRFNAFKKRGAALQTWWFGGNAKEIESTINSSRLDLLSDFLNLPSTWNWYIFLMIPQLEVSLATLWRASCSVFVMLQRRCIMGVTKETFESKVCGYVDVQQIMQK